MDALAGSPCRLEYAKALTAAGQAQLRRGSSETALVTLREALDAADRCGAEALSDAIRGTLVQLGARPRRRRVGGPASLTASEQRVAAIAADGKTNREIAQALFISVRTVEMHLSNSYRKLAISGRPGLAEALSEG